MIKTGNVFLGHLLTETFEEVKVYDGVKTIYNIFPILLVYYSIKNDGLNQ